MLTHWERSFASSSPFFLIHAFLQRSDSTILRGMLSWPQNVVPHSHQHVTTIPSTQNIQNDMYELAEVVVYIVYICIHIITYRTEFLISDWAMIVHVNRSKAKSSCNFGFSLQGALTAPRCPPCWFPNWDKKWFRSRGSGHGHGTTFSKRTHSSSTLIDGIFICSIFVTISGSNSQFKKLIATYYFFHLPASPGGESHPIFSRYPEIWGKFSYWMSIIFQSLWLSQAALPRDCLMDAERLLHQLQAENDCSSAHQDFVKGEKGGKLSLFFCFFLLEYCSKFSEDTTWQRAS